MGTPDDSSIPVALALARIEVTPTGCHVYLGARTKNGYGQIRRGGKGWLAHRWTYTQAYGPIPEGMDLDHLCRVRACCNPAHLEPVSRSVNLRRGEPSTRGTCSRGHLRDEANTRIDKNGWRRCAECDRENCRAQKARRLARG